MICDGCKELADRIPGRGENKHLKHVKKTGVRCIDPKTCTCQHRPKGSWNGGK